MRRFLFEIKRMFNDKMRTFQKYRTRSEKADSRRAFSLLIIAVNVLLLEVSFFGLKTIYKKKKKKKIFQTIYCIFYGYWFVTNVNYQVRYIHPYILYLKMYSYCQVDFRGFMAAFYSLIDVYSCSPSFLLLFFCKSVRERLFAMFR